MLISFCRNEYAQFVKIHTETITMDRSEKDGQQKKAKLFIKLEKHANFDKNIESFEKIKAENEAKNPRPPKKEEGKTQA